MRVPRARTSELWDKLSWTSGRFSFCNSKHQPLHVLGAPSCAGLYRITWVSRDEWLLHTTRKLRVEASQRVEDPVLQVDELSPPVLLTIGRTTDIRKRLRQHFGTNTHNNRVNKRLVNLLSACDHFEICQLAVRSLVAEWVEVPSWVERCLLEHYGQALLRPIFDLDAEH